MEKKDDRHEIVRFRRDDIVRLDSYPSAVAGAPPVAGPKMRLRVPRAILWLALLGLVLIAAVPVVVIFTGVPQFAQDQARNQLEASLTRMAGVPLVAEMGEPKLSIDPSQFIGLLVEDVSIASAETGKPILEVGSLRFGLRMAPMLRGQLQLGSAGVEDAAIYVDRIPTQGGKSFLDTLRGEEGLLQPELIVRAVFDALHRTMDGLAVGSTRRIALTNVRVYLPSGAPVALVRIDTGLVSRARDGSLELTAQARADEHDFKISGSAERDPASQRIANLKANIDLAGGRLWATSKPPATVRKHDVIAVDGAMSLRIAGAQTPQGPGRLGVGADISSLKLTYNDGDTLEVGGRIDTALDVDARKLEILPSEISSGRSRFVFHGAVGPQPDADDGKPAYRFELVSDGSRLAPDISLEPAIMAYARVAGHIDPQAAQLVASEISVRTDSGSASGSALVRFAAGKSPGIDFELLAGDMPVAYAKQIWPWFAAPPARSWVHDNLFGGWVHNARLSLSVPPGRLGDGIPLNDHEMNGHFEIDATRFDLAGQLPAVREGKGAVDILGSKAMIKLAAGRLYLPEDRTVDISDGTFDISRGGRPYVSGELDIRVSGSADAVAALAGYEPINALRQTPITPGDLSGQVSGQVKAHVPLEKAFNGDRTWDVALNFSGLAIAKPIEGQSISAASGTINIDTRFATVEAKASMNGMPATLSLLEPLGQDKAERRRDVTLVLDDKARNAIAPGLASFLSGPVSIRMDDNDGTRAISADLGSARVNVPWAGWSKGPGVPATLNFNLSGSGSDFRLSDVKLSGKTFALNGSATISKGTLVDASFPRVSLNRNDNVAVQVKRAGSGYDISVRGDMLDIRALIKQVLSDGAPEGGEGGQGGRSPSVNVEASVGYVSGFGSESLSNVKLSYRAGGGRATSLDLSASTRAGGGLSVTDKTTDGRRNVVMRSTDAGAVVRFLDLYPHMQGGQIALNLSGSGNEILKGQVDASNFALVNEPRLRSLVGTPSGGGQSLSSAVKRDIDTSRVQFDRGFARIEKGRKYLKIDDGAIRGPLLGTTFRGSLYDQAGNMSISGTFMPAYGINSLFAELPLIGIILGGRDRGLIGITYRVSGNAKSPSLQINPISAIAPGIFRQIFEFN
ncbi:MAG: DUF3971 domain-containing protein [Mesorhizobium sp.]